MRDMQKMLDELPFPAIGLTEEGEFITNELARVQGFLKWVTTSPPPQVKKFLQGEVDKMSRLKVEVDGHPVVASGRFLTGTVAKVLRMIPQL